MKLEKEIMDLKSQVNLRNYDIDGLKKINKSLTLKLEELKLKNAK